MTSSRPHSICRWLTALLILVITAPAHADPLGQWLDDVAKCTAPKSSFFAASKPLALAVIGFDPGQAVLSREQAEEGRLAVEGRLQATGRVTLSAAADVTRIKALREGTTGLSGPDAEQQIRAAFDGDASVFLIDPERKGDIVAFRLQAIGKAVGCK